MGGGGGVEEGGVPEISEKNVGRDFAPIKIMCKFVTLITGRYSKFE
jgi:hypothetical protein